MSRIRVDYLIVLDATSCPLVPSSRPIY